MGIDKIDKILKEAKEFSDRGLSVVKTIEHPKYGTFFLFTKEQLEKSNIDLAKHDALVGEGVV